MTRLTNWLIRRLPDDSTEWLRAAQSEHDVSADRRMRVSPTLLIRLTGRALATSARRTAVRSHLAAITVPIGGALVVAAIFMLVSDETAGFLALAVWWAVVFTPKGFNPKDARRELACLRRKLARRPRSAVGRGGER